MLQECQTQGLAHTSDKREQEVKKVLFLVKASEMKLPVEGQETCCMELYIDLKPRCENSASF